MTKTRKPSVRARLIGAIGVAAVAAPAGALVAGGATASARVAVTQAVSSNWAGYAVSGRHFSGVSGSWTVPAARSTSSSRQSYSAVWVGLGGASSASAALEQVGTQTDYVNGRAEYYAWYELVPAAQVRLKLAIHAGDRISARVAVSGGAVTVALSDRTTGRSVRETLRMSAPDTSSAEWIVEAPSAQSFDGSYQVLPLANFGKVTITGATATAAGHSGAITDQAWSATRIQLRTQSGSAVGPGFVSDESQPVESAGATASTLAGGGFSVKWQAAPLTPASTAGQVPGGFYPPGGGRPGW